jgi:hypothetical protein
MTHYVMLSLLFEYGGPFKKVARCDISSNLQFTNTQGQVKNKINSKLKKEEK